MKRKYFVKKTGVLLLTVLFILSACEVEDPFTVIKSDSSILINGSINNLSLPGGISGGAGAIPPFEVVVNGNVTSIEITNRYVVPPTFAVSSPPTVEKVIGSFPVSEGKATIPAILIADLRLASDPPITSTSNATVNGPGTNSLLIDAVLGDGSKQRRIIALNLASTVILVDNEIYKTSIAGSVSNGVPSFDVIVNSNTPIVRVASRYVLPGSSTTRDNLGTVAIYPTVAVDAVTSSITSPAMTAAQMRWSIDPQITGLADVGQQFLFVEALASTTRVTRTGTITGNAGSTTLTGAGTAFSTQLSAGTLLYNSAGNLIGQVLSIQSNTALTLTGPPLVAVTASAYSTYTVLSSKTINVTW